MRTLLCLLALALPVAALAQPLPDRGADPFADARDDPRYEPMTAPRERAPVRPLLDERFTEAVQRQAAASAARQTEFDRRITERSIRAARSICSGCGTPGGPVGSVTPPGVRRERAEAGLPHDPAQAPLD